MDRDSSYVAGSRHKDNCYWFVNGAALDEYSENSIMEGQSLEDYRLRILASCMGTDRQGMMALEYWAKIN
jgi:hypothetical protein